MGNQAGKGGELSLNETNIIAGALELTEKTARDAMTPISEIFSLDINAKLDRYGVCLYKYTEIIVISFIAIVKYIAIDYMQLCGRNLLISILEKGHSRVPVYYDQPTNIIGLILVILFIFIHVHANL